MSKQLDFVTNRRAPLGDVGIELEVERKPTWTGDWPHVRNWVAKSDGSLRNGIEYITRTPVKADEKLKTRIGSLVDAIKDNVTDNSARTSCHVHVNCLRLTPLQMMNGVFSFWLAEEIISDYWGEERKGNNYCRRLSEWSDISSVVRNIIDDRFYGIGISHATSGLERYSSCNMAAFTKHGSVEFRGMRGTVDTDVLHKWVNTVVHVMHTASKRYKTPKHIFDNYLNTSNVEDFLKKIIGPHIAEHMVFDERHIDLVNDNAIKLATFAHYFDEMDSSWEEWEEKLIAKREQQTTVASTVATATRDAVRSTAEYFAVDPVVSDNYFTNTLRRFTERG